jgi:predicted nucleic acid-binding protein
VFAAILDTNVLLPSLQRDFLLSMAVEGLYRPLWSEAILEELRRHDERLKIKRGAAQADAAARADFLIEQMRENFDDALVHGWEGLEGTYGLPDPNDEHVVAAAVVGGAGVIVTENLKHFRADRVPSHIQILQAKEFAANTADVDPARAAAALRTMADRFHNPPTSARQLLEGLISRYDMVDVGEIVSPMLSDDE